MEPAIAAVAVVLMGGVAWAARVRSRRATAPADRWWLVGALLLVAAASLVMAITERGLGAWDAALAGWGAEQATAASTSVLAQLTRLGGTPTAWTVVFLFAAVEWWRRRSLHATPFLALTVAGNSAIINTLKWLVARERPPVEHLVEASYWSFPSGHAGTAAALWAAVAYVLAASYRSGTRRVLAIGAVAIAVTVAATRVLLGVHWLTDVVAGLAVGWAWFLAVRVAFGDLPDASGRPAPETVES